MGRTLSDFDMEPPLRAHDDSPCPDVLREKSCNIPPLLDYLNDRRPLLNKVKEQRDAYDNLMQKIYSGEGSITLLDAPGGAVETFLINLILAEVRSIGDREQYWLQESKM